MSIRIVLQRVFTRAANACAAIAGQPGVRLASGVDANPPPRSPTDPSPHRTALEKAIQALERQRVILAQDEHRDARAASGMEERAMRAVAEGRDDIAKQALVRHGQHLEQAEMLRIEITELDAALAHYRALLAKQ